MAVTAKITKNDQILYCGHLAVKDCSRVIEKIKTEHGAGVYDCTLTTSNTDYKDHFIIEIK